jgi:2-polyprenyl-3-methyl-5-hydroxy-6-metoxy-1,4-benzoquinol methylase
MATEMDVLVIGNAILRKEDQLPPVPAVIRGDALIPDRLMACLRTPGATEDGSLERIEGAFLSAQAVFPDREGVPSLLRPIEAKGSDSITAKIKSFYEENPFPNYDGVQEFGDLVNRGQKTVFARNLLKTIGFNKLVLECGCGTGQLSHFLSLNNNHVLGVDLSLSSLKFAIEHKRRNRVPRVGFVEMNIFDLGVKDECFDVVISTGVLHHTKDAPAAFASIARKAKPGGLIVVGLYNWYGRVPTWLRAQMIGVLGPNIDRVVRNNIRDKRKAEIWVKDQYYNPHETWHSVDEVMGWFRANNVEYLTCEPPIIGTNAKGSGDMAVARPAGSRTARVLTQLSWLGSIGWEGALFVMVGRKMSDRRNAHMCE